MPATENAFPLQLVENQKSEHTNKIWYSISGNKRKLKKLTMNPIRIQKYMKLWIQTTVSQKWNIENSSDYLKS